MRHYDQPAHKKIESAVKSSRARTVMFSSASSAANLALNDQTLIENTTRAELLHGNFIVQHNLSFRSVNHMSRFCPIMSLDSKIAKKFACARTKTSSVLNEAIMSSLKKYLVDQFSKEL